MTVYLMCGLAFSGKSTVAAAIQRRLGAVLISLDDLNAVRDLHGGVGIPSGEWEQSHREAMARLEQALEAGRDAVVDDTNCFRFLRDRYRAVADRFGADARIIYVDAPLDLVLQRLRANERTPSRPPVTKPVLLDLIRKFEPPAEEEPVLVVPTGCDVDAWVAGHLAAPVGAHPVRIRPEEERDHASLHALNASAFETRAGADLVDALRREATPFLSLVAEAGGSIVGHILFTPVTLPGHPDRMIMGLGPMAVSPGHQRKGIGSALVREGLERCRRLGFGAVVVLGHPGYYPRFGFSPSVRSGIGCEFDAPEEAFMLLELAPGYLRGASGTIQYHPVFRGV